MRRTSEKPLECTPEERQPEDDVAGGDVRPRQQRAALGGADGKAGEIVILAGIKARHFGGLAADQRAPASRQPCAMPGDDCGADVGVELAGRIIVEEEQRLGALHDESLTHIATRSMPIVSWMLLSIAILTLVPTPSLAATRIGSVKPAALRSNRPPKPPISRVGARPPRRAHQRLDLLDHGIAGIDVDAGIRIGQMLF